MTSEQRISNAGELVCRRVLDRDAGGFIAGQHEARIIDPYPRRDRADLAAILTYVDDVRRACSLTCERNRATGRWAPVILHRAGLKGIERATAVGVPTLEGPLLATLEAAAAGVEAFPFEAPSDEELKVRCLARKLWERGAL